ncbi:MAG: phosphate acyltransferase [Bacteroidales bacterium]|nr:phosphate acyltransferase [Bacteroidales bacterium]
MKVGIDIWGGDYVPKNPIEGVKLLMNDKPSDLELVLFGNKKIIEENFRSHELKQIEIIDAPEVITMEDTPANAFTQKQNSSIVQGFKYLQADYIQGFCSAGNTGAMLVGAMQIIKVIDGIIRPCIASFIPHENNSFSLIADVGLNPDAKPEMLLQYAHLTSKYFKYIVGVEKPRVALLNIGSEPEKGNSVTKIAYDLLKNDPKINFIGNIEGYDIFSNICDVIICDGFTGNVILKLGEGFYKMLKRRNMVDSYFEKFNFEYYGGTPILGINKVVVVGHGASTPLAIKNMILLTYNIVKSNLIEHLKTKENAI